MDERQLSVGFDNSGVGVPRIPSLDGLRAISVMSVLFGHVCGTRGFTLFSAYPRVGDVARVGVTVFFVISGFLITGLLMKEQADTGAISLRKFYVRRILRIVPAFLVFVICMMGASAFGFAQLSGVDLATALTWTVNFNPHRSWVLGHLWSLSVEEQFYLLWPITLFICALIRARNWAIAAFIGAPVIRVIMHVVLPHSPLRDLEIFPAVADPMAIGCIVAIERERLLSCRWWLALSQPVAVWPMAALVIVTLRFSGYTVISFFLVPLTLISLAAIVEGSTRWTGAAARALNSHGLVWVGTLSYSLYLWQQPFVNRTSQAWLCSFPVNIVAAFACAMASYYLVERPFLKLRRHFRTVARTTASA
jgi:peptidoglycan/LPS O-acetylase OafA/YrhL